MNIDSNRNNSRSEFLAEYFGSDDFAIDEIAGDASYRKYYLVKKSGQEFILMDAPPEHENLDSFIKIDEILIENGFSAPVIYEQDIENGFLLMEYFGNSKLKDLLEKSEYDEVEIYKKAIDVLIELNEYGELEEWGIEKYDSKKLLTEAEIFFDWYVAKENKHLKEGFVNIVNGLISNLKINFEVLVHRDYHADNLFYLKDREDVRSIGLIDFQDAVIGNPAYDLVSLLEDARRDVSVEVQQKLLKYYIEESGYIEDVFLNDYNVLGAIRNLKIMGIFCRLEERDGKSGYKEMIPRVKSYLLNDLEHPALSELKSFLGENKLL
jgi:aminoglycoside/choline kinase family phosphotransferase